MKKNISDAIRGVETKEMASKYMKKHSKVSKKDKTALIENMEKEMKEAARSLDFERAAQLRDMIFELKSEE